MSSDGRLPTLAEAWQATALLLPVAVALAVPLSAVDLAYAVRAGQLMLAEGQVLRTDPFTFTAGGDPWLNQQWLAQIVFALIHEAGGWPGLVVLRAVLVGLTVALLLDTLRRAGLDPRSAAILTLGAFLLAAPALALRAQLLAVVLFSLTNWALTVGRRNPAVRWLLVPLAALWANVHGTFPLLLGTLAVAWLAELVPAVSAGRSARWRFPALIVATFLASLVNPFGPAVWGYALGLAASPVVSGLASEWQPTSPTTIPSLLFLLALAASLVFIVRSPVRPPWPSIVWLALLALLSLRAERAIVWWALAAAVALAPALALAPAFARLRGMLTMERRSPANAVLVGALVVACLAGLPWWRSGSPSPSRALLTDAPADLTDALAGRIARPTRAYVTQPWASWLEYALPGVLTFVDSRFEVVPPAAWADYLVIAAAEPGWETRLDRWGIALVIVDRTREPNLASALETSPRWEVVASGPVSRGQAFRRVSPTE